MSKKIPVTIWMSEETKAALKRKYYEEKSRNDDIETMDDFIRYLLGTLIKQY